MSYEEPIKRDYKKLDDLSIKVGETLSVYTDSEKKTLHYEMLPCGHMNNLLAHPTTRTKGVCPKGCV